MRHIVMATFAALAACGQVDATIDSEADVKTAEGEVGSSAVSLVYAIGWYSGADPVYAVVEVANLAFDKDVRLHYRLENGTWVDSAPGRYLRSISPTRDLFVVSVPVMTTTFAVRYAAAGRVYWDNNGGQNYFVGDPDPNVRTGIAALGAGRNLAVLTSQECGDNPTYLCVSGLVRALPGNTTMTVHYTTYSSPNDAWRLVNSTASAAPQRPSHGEAATRWFVRIPLNNRATPNASVVEFAAVAHFAGFDAWDKTMPNNFVCDAFSEPRLPNGWRCINGAAYDSRFVLPQNDRRGQLVP